VRRSGPAGSVNGALRSERGCLHGAVDRGKQRRLESACELTQRAPSLARALACFWVGKEREDAVSGERRHVCETATASTEIYSSSVPRLRPLGAVCAIYCLSIYKCCERKNERIMRKANLLHKIKNKPQPPAQLFFAIYSHVAGASPATLR